MQSQVFASVSQADRTSTWFASIAITVLVWTSGSVACGHGSTGASAGTSVVAVGAQPARVTADAPTVTGKRGEAFRDPKPPVVNRLEPPVAPAPSVTAELTFHASPKPLATGAVTVEAPDFLGVGRQPFSPETRLLKNWPVGAGPARVWEFEKGTGYTAPAIAGDRLVYFHRVGNQARVECLHPATGQRYWQFHYPTEFEDRFGYNNGPRASPVIDSDRVFVYGAEGKFFCLELQTGRIMWQRDLSAEFGVPQDFFGVACTPLVVGDRVIINVGAPNGPCVAAFDKRTGRMDWGAGTEWGPSYASPVFAQVHGRPRVLVFAGGESRPPTGGLIVLNPTDGALDFSFPWRSDTFESVNAACPLVIGNQVFISANYGRGSALLDLLPDGGHRLAWTCDGLGTHWNTAVFDDQCIYGFDGHFENDSALCCVDRATGRLLWRQEPMWDESIEVNGRRRSVTVSTFRGTLLAVDGHYLCIGELGHLLWLDLSREGYRVLSRSWLFAARESWSPPVLSRGLLYVSQHTRGVVKGESPRLICFDLREKLANGESDARPATDDPKHARDQ